MAPPRFEVKIEYVDRVVYIFENSEIKDADDALKAGREFFQHGMGSLLEMPNNAYPVDAPKYIPYEDNEEDNRLISVISVREIKERET